MPAYNAARFIDAAIGSIRGQTLTDWEMLIVDDGSTDDTASIAERHANEDSRLRVIRQRNAGQAAANNHAIPQARAEYIARMDADDIALPHRLAALCDVLDRHSEIVMVGTNVIQCDAGGKDLKTTRLPEDDDTIRVHLFSRRENGFCNPTLVFRKSAWERCGGERPCFGHAHDLDLNLRLAEQGEVRNLASPSLRYRLHAGQVSTMATERQAAGALAAFICADARRHGVSEPAFTARCEPVDASMLRAAGANGREIDDAILANIVESHERLCLLGHVAEARDLRQRTRRSFSGTPARQRHARAQCVMTFHEGRAAKSIVRRLVTWASGMWFLRAALHGRSQRTAISRP